MVTEAALERGRCSLLLRVRANQRRAQVHDQRPACVDVGVGRRRSGQPPRSGPGCRPGGRDRRQSLRVGGEGVDRAGHCRVGGDRAEQLRRCSQQRDIGQAVRAEGKCHGKVDQHLGWIVAGQRLAPGHQRHRQQPVQPRRPDRLKQQYRARVRHRRPTRRINPQPRIEPATVPHQKGAPASARIWTVASHILAGHEHFSVDRHDLSVEGRELARWRCLAVGHEAAVAGRFPSSRSSSGPWSGRSVSSSRPSNRACGSPAHGSPTSFTAGVRCHPPGPEGSGCGDGPIKADQAQVVR